MKAFMNRDFLLNGKIAKKLYHTVAEDLPIIDYHCHLPVKQIAENYAFKNAFDLFLSGDHYKWRQMRTAGIDEKYITGDADDYEKFFAFAKMMPSLFGNPIYHWTHLELQRYFGITEPLSEKNAKIVWEIVGACLAKEEYRARGLILRSGVEVVCTTDDPADTLEYHEQIAALPDFPVKVLPTFRPDNALGIEKDGFLPYLEKIGVTSFDGLLEWLESRLDFFTSLGCRVTDHALAYVPFREGHAEDVFKRRLAGEAIDAEDIEVYKTAVLLFLGRAYAKRGLAMQLHLGALRNNNRRMFEKIGPDTGFDSMDDEKIAAPLSAFLSKLDYEGTLPKTVLYNLNPKDNYTLGSMIGNFQDGSAPGKMQFGAGWWFCDQMEGMRAQMGALSSLGMLSKFVGMLTDSRSFVSYPRHEYFRRILCDLIGGAVERGEYPNDFEALSKIVADICYFNAKNYFGF